MKKRIFSLLLALCLLSGNCLTVFADETEPASQESTAEAMTTETQEQTQPQPILEEPAPIQPETQPQSPVSPQTEPTAPVLTPDSLSIDNIPEWIKPTGLDILARSQMANCDWCSLC